MSRESWAAEVAVGSADGPGFVTRLGPVVGPRRGLTVPVPEAGLGGGMRCRKCCRFAVSHTFPGFSAGS